MILCFSKLFILSLTLSKSTFAPNKASKSVWILSKVRKEGVLPS